MTPSSYIPSQFKYTQQSQINFHVEAFPNLNQIYPKKSNLDRKQSQWKQSHAEHIFSCKVIPLMPACFRRAVMISYTFQTGINNPSSQYLILDGYGLGGDVELEEDFYTINAQH